MADVPPLPDRLAQLVAVGTRFGDDSPVAPEDFLDAHVDPPLTWGELRSLCATRRSLLAATDAATAHGHEQLAQHLPPPTAATAAEAIRALFRARYSLPPALSASGTPLHLVDEFGAAFKLTADEEAVWARLTSRGASHHAAPTAGTSRIEADTPMPPATDRYTPLDAFLGQGWTLRAWRRSPDPDHHEVFVALAPAARYLQFFHTLTDVSTLDTCAFSMYLDNDGRWLPIASGAGLHAALAALADHLAPAVQAQRHHDPVWKKAVERAYDRLTVA